MRNRLHQRFTLLDAMALVAGSALGLGLMRGLTLERFTIRYDPIGPMSPRWGQPWTTRDWADWAIETSLNRYYCLMPLLACLTVTVLALRLRPPRPRLVRLLRQPGTAAALAATSNFMIWLPVWLTQAIQSPHDEWYLYSSFLAISTASAVGSSWVILLVGGRWRADTGWSDRLGRLLAAAWLVPILLYMIETFIS